MSKFINNPFLKIVCLFILISTINCSKKKPNFEAKNQKFIELKAAYDTVSTKEGFQQVFTMFESDENDKINLYNKILFQNKTNWDRRNTLSLIDSANTLAEAEEFPETMLNYINYMGARIELKFNRPKQAYQYILKSNESIKDYPQLFEKEKSRNESFKDLISNSFFNSSKIKYNNLKKRLNSDTLNTAQKLNMYYNMAFYCYDMKDYNGSQYYLNSYLKEKEHIEDHYLYSDAMSVNALNFSELKQYDSVLKIDKKIYDEFQNQIISEKQYNAYLAHSLKAYFPILSRKELEERIGKLSSYFNFPESNNYFKTVVLERETMYFESLKDLAKEKDALIRANNNIIQNPEIDDYRMKEQNRIYRRLIAISIQQNDEEATRKWYGKLKELEQLQKNIKKEYVAFLQSLSYRDLELSRNNYKKLNENVESQQNINMLYFSIVVVFLILVLYSSVLLFKSQIYKKRIKEKYDQLSIENKTIREQNKKLKIAIGTLKESNGDLNNFAKVAAHDIKSPISTINSGINYLRDIYSDQIKPGHFKFFDNLENSVSELVNMINSLLNQNKKM